MGNRIDKGVMNGKEKEVKKENSKYYEYNLYISCHLQSRIYNILSNFTLLLSLQQCISLRFGGKLISSFNLILLFSQYNLFIVNGKLTR
jgi:hypothetical protein